jgi:curved DNA-binding protein CbpA
MPGGASSPFTLLGVDPDADLRDIRRAYRRAIVRVHRSGVLDIVDDLAALKRAYEILRDPAARARFRGRGDATSARVRRAWAAPGTTEARLRSEARSELRQVSLRSAADAKQEHGDTVEALATEWDRRERAALLRAERTARWMLAVKVLGSAAVLAGLVEVCLHLTWR